MVVVEERLLFPVAILGKGAFLLVLLLAILRGFPVHSEVQHSPLSPPLKQRNFFAGFSHGIMPSLGRRPRRLRACPGSSSSWTHCQPFLRERGEGSLALALSFQVHDETFRVTSLPPD